MSIRPILIITAIAAAAALTGCSDTTRGLQARERARERLNVVNAKLSYDQAEQAFKAGQFEKASKELQVAIQLNPESAKYRLLEGRIYVETHRLEEAVESFKAAIERDPKLADAHYYTGIVFQRWSNDASAYDHYMEAYDLEPNSVAYLLAAAESMIALDQYGAAKRLIESKLAHFEYSAALRQLLGQLAMLQDEPEVAVNHLADAWRLTPEDDGLLQELAQAQYAAGRFEECHRSIKTLQDRFGAQDPELLHFEARCLSMLKRLPESRNLYLQLTQLTPTEVSTWVELGTVAWELGDYHRMALCGARITALAPDRFEGYMLKGLNQRNHGKVEEAITLLEQAADRSPDMAMPHLVLGRTLEESGDEEGALDAYAAAVRAEPENAAAQALFSALSETLDVATAQPEAMPRK